MKINKVFVLFIFAACCFLAGTINHIVNTGEGWVSSLLLAAGCLCGAFVFGIKKKKKTIFPFRFEHDLRERRKEWNKNKGCCISELYGG